ncbi:MAG: aminotransferase class I/II-fold pyridoxal phosphate-dependent enzyme [Acidiferrobacterales bacterium]|nr:aminotransferase class I/II-fold pyridoxal phosphate-dependent enzyme [Acidiferrobacterales bacterium]
MSTNNAGRKLSLETRAIHAGEPSPRIGGAITLPIFQSSTYESTREDNYHAIPYLRLNNSPNHLSLHAKLADLECTEAGLVTASGMAAITTALLSVLKAGDHLLVQSGLYGGTHTFITHDLPQLGVSFDFVDLNDPGEWQTKLRSNTRAFYAESMTNPLLTVGDLPAVVDFCRENDLVSMIDNTLASPVNFQPATIGFDLVLHSCTKYLNGHSDIVAGAILGNEEHVQAAKLKLDHYGATLDPHACFLLQRGIKTLSLRVNKQNSNAMAVARLLEKHPKVTKVNYAGLPSHVDHHRASKLFRGYGGLLSFDHCEGSLGAHQLIDRLNLVTEAVSLGGTETLATIPAESSHAGVSEAERNAIGIGSGLVRLAIGIEGEQDLLDDFTQALSN